MLTANAGATNRLAECLHMGRQVMKYNKDQWISSFEDTMVGLRPHMSARVLAAICVMAWNRYGKNDVDPHKAAGEWSASMDKPK
jgi:hypothetical protein